MSPRRGGSPPTLSVAKRLLYASIPLVVLLALLGAVEGVLRWRGYEGTTLADIQATQGFQRTYYVWRRDRVLGPWLLQERAADGTLHVRTNPAISVRGLHEAAFPVEEPAVRRYFTLGGSTVQGLLSDDGFGFPAHLAQRLAERVPDQEWRVVNLGVGGLDSMSLPEQVEEIAGIGADGILVYVGDNEMGGTLVRDCTNAHREGLERWLNRVRLVRALRSGWRAWKGTGDILPAEGVMTHQVQCMAMALDRRLAEIRSQAPHGSAAPPVRQDALHATTLEVLERNLERAVRRARRAGIHVWIVLPPINYLDPPVAPSPGHCSPPRTRRRRKRPGREPEARGVGGTCRQPNRRRAAWWPWTPPMQAGPGSLGSSSSKGVMPPRPAPSWRGPWTGTGCPPGRPTPSWRWSVRSAPGTRPKSPAST